MMAESQVIIVILRRPNRANPEEMRTDPLWEFGSFGCTGCHNRNLMNPRKIKKIDGARLAFAQGGDHGFKLVYLTPSVRTFLHGNIAEAKWKYTGMPIRYDLAPVLINNDGKSDCRLLKNLLRSVKCLSWEARFASKFRSCRTPLDARIANELVKVFNRAVSVSHDIFASNYVDAMPWPPPNPDKHRRQTYFKLLRNAEEQ
jgi:hypothetical protein